MSQTKPKPIICGSIAIDRLARFNGRLVDVFRPDYLGGLSASILVGEQTESYGGTGGNVTYSLALLGENPVLVGSAGKEAVDYLRFLEQAGADASQINISRKPTAQYSGIIDNEDNKFGSIRPGAMSDAPRADIKSIAAEDDIVVISAHDPETMLDQLQACRAAGSRLVYSPSQQVANLSAEDLRLGLGIAEVTVVNQYESELLADRLETTVAGLQANLPVFVITKGRHGSVVSGSRVPGVFVEVPAAESVRVIDPSGSGDAYLAGFLAGYLRDWDLVTCTKMGAVASSFAIERAGSQGHNFNKATFSQRYYQAFGQEIQL